MSRLTWDELDSSNPAYDTGKAIVKAAQGAYCAGYRQFPAFYNGSSLGENPVSDFNRSLNNSICKNDPGGLPPLPAPPAQGGQCQGVQYSIVGSVRFKITGFPEEYDSPFDAGGGNGAIHLSGLRQDGTSWYVDAKLGVSPQNPSGQPFRVTLLQQPINPAVRYEFLGYSIGFRRVDGLPDGNCGTMPPVQSDERLPPLLQINNNVTVNLDANVTINVPVTIQNDITNNIFAPTVNLGGIDVNFDLGGANVNVPTLPPSGGGGGATDLTPVLNQTTQLLRDVDDVYDVVNDIYNSRVYFEDDTIVIAGCSDEGVVQRQIPVKVLRDENGNSQSTLYDLLFAEIFQLRTQGLIDCASEFDPIEITEGEVVTPGDVFYTALQTPPTIGYLIEITEFDAAEVRTYKLAGDEDIECGFGNVCIANSDYSTRGDFIFMRTRRLFIDARDVNVPHYVRISLKLGTKFRVINLGYRQR